MNENFDSLTNSPKQTSITKVGDADFLRQRGAENYEAIINLVHEFKNNAHEQASKHHVENALRIIFWPITENVWNKAEAICMETAKGILNKMLIGEECLQTPAPNLKECLLAIVFLGEMQDSKSP